MKRVIPPGVCLVPSAADAEAPTLAELATATRLACFDAQPLPPVTATMIDPHIQCHHPSTSTRRIAVHVSAGVVRGLSGDVDVCDSCGEITGGAIVRMKP